MYIINMDTITHISIDSTTQGNITFYYASFRHRYQLLNSTYRTNVWLSKTYKTKARAEKVLAKKLEQMKPYATISNF
jgi:hypothetical protein